MVCVPTVHAIYLYGGLVAPDPDEDTETEYTSNEIWKFSLDSKRWTQVQVSRQRLIQALKFVLKMSSLGCPKDYHL
jgi:hypothetical protein